MLNSGIEYIDHSWNPWIGCHKVSEGCANCYMYREQKRFGHDPSIVRSTGSATWRQAGKFEPGSVVFVCTWSDFWIEEADPWRDEAWRVIKSRPDVRWLLVTKRPERIAGRLPWGDEPWPNVVGIVTAESQAMADLRIPILLRSNFALRGVSVEPMLGPVDIEVDTWWDDPVAGIMWVICGTESGPNRRPADIDDIRSLKNQCFEASIPFFLKQMEIDGRVVKAPMLDGEQWLERPWQIE